MAYEYARQVARRAAALLPEPPPAHDAFGYLAWEELAVSTARRLQPLLDDTMLRTRHLTAPHSMIPGRLDGDALLALAAILLMHDDADSACSELLSAAAAG